MGRETWLKCDRRFFGTEVSKGYNKMVKLNRLSLKVPHYKRILMENKSSGNSRKFQYTNW